MAPQSSGRREERRLGGGLGCEGGEIEAWG